MDTSRRRPRPFVPWILSRVCVCLLFVAVIGLPSLFANTGLKSQYLHQTWQFEDGLPQNIVQAICQTRDGYLWVGTQNGLARFDGIQFTVFNPRNTPGLKHANISALLETRDGSFWIGTEGGGLTRRKDGTMETFTQSDGLAGDIIRSLFEAKDGTLWIGSRGEKTKFILSKYQNGKFEIVKQLNDFDAHATRAITEDRSGTIWIATSKGIARLKNDQYEFEPHMYLRTVFVDRSGAVWLSSNGGMWRYDKRQVFTKKDGLADSNVATLFEDSSGTLWAGTFGGLARRTAGQFEIELNKENIAYDAVNAIYEDREKNIWIGAKDGLSRLARRTFFSYTRDHGLAHNNVMSVFEDKDEVLWAATWGGGLNRLQDGIFTVFGKAHGMSNDLVLAIHKSTDGTLWFGNDYTGGLHKMANGVVTPVVPGTNVPPITIRAILEDRKGDLWIGGHLGLIQWRPGSASSRTYTVTNGLAADLIKVLHEDRDGRLWVGTTGGLSRLDSGRFTTFTTSHGLGSKAIAAIFSDSAGTIWVGTVGGGLSRWDGTRFKTYTMQQGLFTDDIWEILEDDNRRLWMSSRTGIFRVALDDFDRFDRGEISSLPFTSFGRYDGMVSIECNSVAKPAGWKSRDGRLWFATAKGLVVVDPKAEGIGNELPPVVLLEQVIAGGEKLATEGTIKLDPGQRHLEFRYTALNFRAPQKLRFKYKLTGVDSDWVEAGSRRVAFYNNLKPGNYEFHVIACNSHSVWNKEGAKVSLTLAPYFHQTAAFYVFCGVGVLLLGASIYQLRVRSLKLREQHLENLVTERTKTLEAAVAERQRIQNELMEMSRKAGMAEVASGVLHNVGNVLNSVNVSATLAADKVRYSKISRVDQLASLVATHDQDFAAFAATEKGKQLPAYLKTLAQHLAEEQQVVTEELTILRKNVEHIKEIVAMQQSLAKVGGVVESLSLPEVVDDALQVTRTSLDDHDIQIVRDYQTKKPVVIDKHKVLQILINLLRNAQQSCVESGKANKQIKISIHPCGRNNVRIIVADNGGGIPPENLMRIFSQGFTTRPNGHGFGLHSAAIAAREMGGCISVSSDGEGQGASFVLELPIRPAARDELQGT